MPHVHVYVIDAYLKSNYHWLTSKTSGDAHGVYWTEWEGYAPGNVFMLPHSP